MNYRERKLREDSEALGRIIGIFLSLITSIVVFTWLTMLILGVLFNELGIGAAVPFFSPAPWLFGGILGYLFWRVT